MPYLVKDLFNRVHAILSDMGATKRWPYTELLDWMNDGAIRIAAAKPNANVVPEDIPLASGAEQTLPADAITLVRALASLTGGPRAVTIVSRATLDGFNPGWRDPAVTTATAAIDHVIYDPADPEIFHVYPPNDGTGILRAELAKVPAPVALPGTPEDIASYSMALPLGDQYIGPLVDFLCYRAFSKDSTMPNAANRSTTHFQHFQQSIGEKVQRDMTMIAPTSHALPLT